MNTEQLFAIQRAGIYAWLELCRGQLAALEQFSAASLGTAQAVAEDSLTHAQALFEARTLQDAAALNLAAAPKHVEHAKRNAQSLLTWSQQQREALNTYADAQRAHVDRLIDAWTEFGASAAQAYSRAGASSS